MVHRWQGGKKKKGESSTDRHLDRVGEWEEWDNLFFAYFVSNQVMMWSTVSYKYYTHFSPPPMSRFFLFKESSKNYNALEASFPFQSLGIHPIHLKPFPASWSSHNLLLTHADHTNGNLHPMLMRNSSINTKMVDLLHVCTCTCPSLSTLSTHCLLRLLDLPLE